MRRILMALTGTWNEIRKDQFLSAAAQGNLSVVSQYIEENVDAPDALNVTDRQGHTALMLACENHKADVVLTLIQRLGPAVNFRSGESTALSVAAHYSDDSAESRKIIRIFKNNPDLKFNPGDAKAILIQALLGKLQHRDTLDTFKELLTIPAISNDLETLKLVRHYALGVNNAEYVRSLDNIIIPAEPFDKNKVHDLSEFLIQIKNGRVPPNILRGNVRNGVHEFHDRKNNFIYRVTCNNPENLPKLTIIEAAELFKSQPDITRRFMIELLGNIPLNKSDHEKLKNILGEKFDIFINEYQTAQSIIEKYEAEKIRDLSEFLVFIKNGKVAPNLLRGNVKEGIYEFHDKKNNFIYHVTCNNAENLPKLSITEAAEIFKSQPDIIQRFSIELLGNLVPLNMNDHDKLKGILGEKLATFINQCETAQKIKKTTETLSAEKNYSHNFFQPATPLPSDDKENKPQNTPGNTRPGK